MKKALGILKEIENLSGWVKIGAELPSDEELSGAIKELEEAMKPKTCYWCKHYEEKQCTNENSIAFGGINAVYEDDFCNDFEPKDNA